MKTIKEKKQRIAELGKELQSLMYEIGMHKPGHEEYSSFNVWDKNGEGCNSVHWINHTSDNDIEIEF